jgi:predicted esterase
MRILFFLLVAGILLATVPLQAQQISRTHGLETGYLLSLPDGYKEDTAKRWPLVIFLHGSGESGTDIEKVKSQGLPKLLEQGKKFPFIVVSPQAMRGFGWEPAVLYHLLLFIKEKFRVDNTRIYLTGLSMGGNGTWRFAMEHPEEFAAIAPICGPEADTTNIWRLRNMPVWCFHGAKDNAVSLRDSETMIGALKKYNRGVKFTVYPEAGHDSWTATYANDSLYNWLLSHQKHVHKQTAINKSLLGKYAGTFSDGEKITFTFVPGDAVLEATNSRGNKTILKPSSDTTFFANENDPFIVEFVKDTRGNVSKAIFWTDKKNVLGRTN